MSEDRQERVAAAQDVWANVDALNQLAWEQGARDPREALRLSEQAFELATTVADPPYTAGAARSLFNSGRFHYQLAHLDEAQRSMERARTLLEHHDHPLLLGKISMGIGLIHWRLSDYTVALNWLLDALAIFRAEGEPADEAQVLSNLGMVYGVIGEYDHARDVYRQALAIYEEGQQKSGYGLALNNLAMVYLAAGDYWLALENASRSLGVARSLGDRSMEINALDTVGSAYLHLGEAEKALRHLERSAELAARLGHRHEELAARIHIGELHLHESRLEAAREALEQALDLAEELGDREQLRHCYEQLSQLHERFGEYESALDYYRRFHETDAAIYRKRADMRFKTLQVVHETETARKEAELAHVRNVRLEKEIAERRQVEAALRASEEQFRRLMEESPISIQVHARDGALLYANDAWHEIWRVDRGQDAGAFNLRHGEIIRKLGLDKVAERFFKEESLHLPDFYVDPERLDGRGPGRWLRIHSYHLLDESGSLRKLVILTEDVTEQRQMEKRLRAAQRRESLSILAGGVAHDFNNLLVAILGQTSIALEQLPAGHGARAHLEKAYTATERASTLTQQMLAYSGKGHFELQRLDLNQLIRDNEEFLAAGLPESPRLQVRLGSGPMPIRADAGQLRHLLLNLLLNGAEAVGNRPGELVISTERVVRSESELAAYSGYTDQALAPGPFIALSISDSGHGMAADVEAQIFDPFFTTKEKGRGLGLAAVLGIVRGHHAGLAVHTVPGEGSTIQVLFPAVVGERPQEEEKRPPRHIKGTVLLIDDEEPVREAVRDILALEKIPVLMAAGGAEGLDLYREHQGEIALVLLDLSMPRMSGQQTLAHLRQIDPSVPVILSSGYSEQEVARRLDGQTTADFLKKPYSLTGLLDKVKEYVAPA